MSSDTRRIRSSGGRRTALSDSTPSELDVPDANPAPGLLSGVKVVALGAFVAGNVLPQILAELGAEVVKVESRKRPEALRSYFSVDHGEVFEPSGVRTAAMFGSLSRSAKNVCVELDTPEGRGVLKSLGSNADIVFENQGPGIIDRWGCSYAALSAINPRVVMVSISGYGRTGPRSEYRAYASSIASYLGLVSAWAHDGVHFDYIAAYHGAYAAVAAWMRADRTGHGAYLDVSQMDAGAAVMAPLYLDELSNGRPWAYAPNEIPGALMSTVVRCSGADAWAAIEIEDLEDWQALCAVLERPALTATSADEARRHLAELQGVLQQWALALTPFQVALKLQAAGLAAAPVQNSEDLWRDPQLRERGAYQEVHHPDLGTIEQPQSPDRMSNTPGHIIDRSHRLGQDTTDVLERWLGLDEDGVGALIDAGVVWQAPAG